MNRTRATLFLIIPSEWSRRFGIMDGRNNRFITLAAAITVDDGLSRG